MPTLPFVSSPGLGFHARSQLVGTIMSAVVLADQQLHPCSLQMMLLFFAPTLIMQLKNLQHSG